MHVAEVAIVVVVVVVVAAAQSRHYYDIILYSLFYCFITSLWGLLQICYVLIIYNTIISCCCCCCWLNGCFRVCYDNY